MSLVAFAALLPGETVTSEVRDDGKTYIYRSFEGVKVDISTVGSANLADAKTDATTAVGNHKTAIGVVKAGYGDMITALAAAPGGTHLDTDAFGNQITINEYTVSGLVYYVPSTEVAAVDALHDEWVANIDLNRTHDDDITAAIAAL